MNWDERYYATRSLTLTLGAEGGLLASHAFANASIIAIDVLPILGAFSAPITPKDALARLRTEFELDEEDFGKTVTGLLKAGILVSVDKGHNPIQSSPFALATPHFQMLRDTIRVMAYKDAITRNAGGKHVLEIGAGTGILSIFAAKAGARRITAIEETAVAAVAKEMFAANGCAKTIDLRVANSQNVELEERVDLIVHEIIGDDPLEENLLGSIADARRFLKPGGRLLPFRLEIWGVGVGLPADDYHRRQAALRQTEELGRLYDIDFTPFKEWLGQTAPLDLMVARKDARAREVLPVLTDAAQLVDLDLYTTTAQPPESANATLKVHSPGCLAGLLIYFRAHLDERTILCNGPDAPDMAWGKVVKAFPTLRTVKEGDDVGVSLVNATIAGRPGYKAKLV